jgi:MFS family permease
VVIVIAQPIVLRFARNTGAVPLIMAGAVLIGLGLGANAFAGTALAYAATCAVWTLGEIGISTGAPVVVAHLAPAHRRGAYQGVLQLAWCLAGALAPAAGSWVLSQAGGGALWLGCLLAALLAAALHATITTRWARERGLR